MKPLSFLLALIVGVLASSQTAEPADPGVTSGAMGVQLFNGVPGTYGWYRVDAHGQPVPIVYSSGKTKARCAAWFQVGPSSAAPYGGHVCCNSTNQMAGLLATNAQVHGLPLTP